MSPLWTDMAIARAAHAAAAARGVVDNPDRRDPHSRADSGQRSARDRRQSPRRPIRRSITSYAL